MFTKSNIYAGVKLLSQTGKRVEVIESNGKFDLKIGSETVVKTKTLLTVAKYLNDAKCVFALQTSKRTVKWGVVCPNKDKEYISSLATNGYQYVGFWDKRFNFQKPNGNTRGGKLVSAKDSDLLDGNIYDMLRYDLSRK